MEADISLTPRRIKLLNTDASQARIRSIRSYIENKYTVYKKSKEGPDAKEYNGPFHRLDYQKVCPGAILKDEGQRYIYLLHSACLNKQLFLMKSEEYVWLVDWRIWRAANKSFLLTGFFLSNCKKFYFSKYFQQFSNIC